MHGPPMAIRAAGNPVRYRPTMSRTPRIESHRRSPSIALPGVDEDDKSGQKSRHHRSSGRGWRRTEGRGGRERRRPALFMWIALAALVLALVMAFDPFDLREKPIPPLVPPTPTKAPLPMPGG